MNRNLAALLLAPMLAVGPGGCATGTPADGEHRIEARDGSFTVDVPEDWTSRPESLSGNSLLAIESPDPAVHLLATSFDTTGGAEDQAVYSAAGLAGGARSCERRDHVADFGGDHVVLDCHGSAQGRTLRSLLIPIVHDRTSVLVLVQIWGDTMAETVPVVRPILSSWDWS